MGLGIAIGGSIAALTIFVIILTYPMVSEKLVETTNARSETLRIDNIIAKTHFTIESLGATNGDNLVSMDIVNTGSEKLWNFEDYNLIVTYHADIGGTLTPTTEQISFNSALSFTESGTSGTNQFLRPDSDINPGNWDDPCPGCDTDAELFDEIDEVSQDNSDYVTSDTLLIINDQDVLEVGLTDVTDPESSEEHTVRYAYRKSQVGGITIDMTVRLLQGAAEIASWTHNDISNSFTTSSQTLSDSQINQITDYSDLRLEFTVEYVSGVAPFSEVDISWAEIEIPPSPIDYDCSPLGLSSGEWSLDRMNDDVIDPRVINKNERSNVCISLSNPVFAGGNVQILLSNQYGVTASQFVSAL